jgi:hypothetical protein
MFFDFFVGHSMTRALFSRAKLIEKTRTGKVLVGNDQITKEIF